VYKTCRKFQKIFKQRCYVKSFCKKFKIKWRYYCVLLLVRETAVREKREHRSRHALDGLLSRCLLLNANVTNRECLPYLRMVLESCSLHTLHDECSALLASQSTAVAPEPCLAARRTAQSGTSKPRKCDRCQMQSPWNNAKRVHSPTQIRHSRTYFQYGMWR